MNSVIEHDSREQVLDFLAKTLLLCYRFKVAQYLWLWFLTPLTGIAAPAIAGLWGLWLLYQIFMQPSNADPVSPLLTTLVPESPLVRTLIYVIGYGFIYTIVLGAGWLLS